VFGCLSWACLVCTKDEIPHRLDLNRQEKLGDLSKKGTVHEKPTITSATMGASLSADIHPSASKYL
jgi:hypothetical protein